jgi:sugar lactone lactonase YvrE
MRMHPTRMNGAALAVLLVATAGCGRTTDASPPEPPCRVEVVDIVPVASAADPEGISSADGRLLVSTLDGTLLAGEAADPAGLAVLAPPTRTRTAAGGLRAVGDRLVVVAGLRSRVVDVLDAATGHVVASRPTPDDARPNDVEISDGTVYVSDTQHDRVFAADLGPDGALGELEPFADLDGVLDRANGMALSPDGSALLVVGTSRGLARVDLATRAVTAVEGAERLYGDGLLVRRGRLYTSIRFVLTVLDVTADGTRVQPRGRVEVDAPAQLATLTSDGDDVLVLASALDYDGVGDDNAVLRLGTAGCP